MKNEVHYDAFISYRRDNGFYLARLVRDQLEKRGISVFLDLEELRSGEFNQKLYEAIQNSKNFILILPMGALDRCIYEDDWVRKEIIAAIKTGSNIIPVLGENFQWPRELYDKMPEEIKSLEHFSGVKTSKDYLDAMINRLISFMYDVNQSDKLNNKEKKQIEREYISSEKYFYDGMQDSRNVESIDMAFHAGAEWFTSIEKNDLLYNIISRGIHVRILLNDPETSELIAQHMRHHRKKYMMFDECIQNWKNLKNEYSNEMEVRLVNIPILRRYYSFHMKDACMDTVNVKYYTYGNAKPDKNYQPIFYCDSPYFTLYRSEFEYLWERSVEPDIPNDITRGLKKEKQVDTVTFFNESMKQLGNILEIDMSFRAGSEWHLDSNVVELLYSILERNIKLRVLVNNSTSVETTAVHMRQPLKKYYGYDKSLSDWMELAKTYPKLVTVRVADIPLMRRYYNIKGKDKSIAKISYYTYGNYSPNRDYQMTVNTNDRGYSLYAEEFEYLWEKGSHIE